jgi:16S rRNA (uracil1498-N3)-methyltransferase
VVHPKDVDRLERAVIEASKQCGRNILMTVGPVTAWADYCRSADLPAERWVAHLGGQPVSGDGRGDVAVAVGPEGGLTDEEVEAAKAAGWRVIGLGPRVLRVETAAVAVAVICAARCGLP